MKVTKQNPKTTNNIISSVFFQIYDKRFQGSFFAVENEEKGIEYEEHFDHVSFMSFLAKDMTLYKRFMYKPLSSLYKGILIFLETNLGNYISALQGKLENPLPTVHTQGDEKEVEKKIHEIIKNYITRSGIISGVDFKDETFRIFLLHSFDEYDKMLREKADEMIKKAISTDIDKFITHLKELKAQNPRIELANKLSPILGNFNVKIDTEWANGGIRLKTLQDTDFEMNVASTGTKHILLSSLPLALLETAHKVILFDEPETSLYPDTQRVIIKHYTDLAPEAQFFFATHSPLIASQFEPWEIVELKFNEEGKVYRELYYKGENHVDNYTIFPEYLRWDSILTKVFDLGVKGNEKHLIKLKELANLEIKLRNAPEEQKREIWKDYEKLANLLDWNIGK